MTYYSFSKWGVKLPVAMEKPQRPTEELVSRTVARIIDRTLEMGMNPYEQAREAEVHSLTGILPDPNGTDEQEAQANKTQLQEWIMGTEEMQEALIMFRNSRPRQTVNNQVETWQMSQEEVEELNVETLLLNLMPTEGDWQ